MRLQKQGRCRFSIAVEVVFTLVRTGKGVPDIENIKALANVFQMTTDELLEIVDEKVSEKQKKQLCQTDR